MRLRTRIFGIVALVFFTMSVASCAFLEKKKILPPGQAKKLTGQQSAAHYPALWTAIDVAKPAFPSIVGRSLTEPWNQ